ncbi:Nat2 [Kluyveromyces lactis]|nr:Nat2 [Kluyveromyces lactis]
MFKFTTRIGLKTGPKYGSNPIIRRAYTQHLKGKATAKEPTGLKKLIKQYGWSALGVYLGLSCIDLPICFLAVHSLGEETIKVYINRVKQLANYGKDEQELRNEIREKQNREELDRQSGAQNKSVWENFKESTLLTEILIAYGIHKSLIFIRVPITAAITPSVVKVLRRFGFSADKFNKGFKTMADGAKIRNKTGKPDDFIKNGSVPKSEFSKGKKWFNGMM